MRSTMYQYIKVDWIHSNPEDPVVLYSELDQEQWERRKVEVYASGVMDYADSHSATGTTRLSIEPIPPLEELSQEFKAQYLDATEFEQVWSMATN